MKRGMIQEVRRLRKSGVTFRRLKELGLEYGILVDYLTSPFPKDELIRRINAADWHFAKRQLTWFKRSVDIRWIKNEKEAERVIQSFLAPKDKGGSKSMPKAKVFRLLGR